jgi:hypothetical protein
MKYIVAGVVGWLFLPALVYANEYPTVDRVEYVHACMRDNSGSPAQELVYKCSCMIDKIAEELTYDEFVDESTAANSFTIAGEIGETVRAYEPLRQMAQKYRALQAKAKKACFLK